MRNGIRLGRLFGIQVTLDFSWVVVFLLVCWNLTMVFATWHPSWSFLESVLLAVAAAGLFFASVLAHEFAHSLVAQSYGVGVSEIRLFLFGGVSNLEREPPSPEAELATTIVGPVTSIGIGASMLLVARLFMPASTPNHFVEAIASTSALGTLLVWLGAVNVGVGIFNLIPGFPLDGGRILRALIWAATRDLRRATLWSTTVGQIVGFSFVFVGAATFFGVHFPFLGQGAASGLWLAFIGWFLASSARTSYRNVFLHDALEGVHVRELMRRTRFVMPTETNVGEAMRQWFMRSSEHAFPVVDASGGFVGLLCASDARKLPEQAWNRTPVTQVMTPLADLIVATPREDAASALTKLGSRDVEQLPVVREGSDELVGVLERRDVARWLELRLGPPFQYPRHA